MGTKCSPTTSLRITRLFLLSFFALLVSFGATSARADDVTYVYTGNIFTNVDTLACGGACGITVSLTLPGPLADGMALQFVNPSVFSITDGLGNSLDQNSNLMSSVFEFATGAGGNITSWVVVLENSTDTLEMYTENVPAIVEDYTFYNGNNGYNQNDAGT